MNADEIARILDELGQRIGPTGEYVFGLAVRQAIIGGVVGLVASLVALVAAGLALRFAWRQYQSCECRRVSYSVCGWEPIGVAVGIVSALVGFCAVVVLADSTFRLLNPEYAALRDLLGLLVP